MIPYGRGPEQYSAMYRRQLERVSAEAIEAFRDLLARDVPQDVDEASVVIFIEDHAGTPNAWMYFTAEHNRVDPKDESIFPGRSMELKLGLQSLSRIDERYFDPDQFPGIELALPLLRGWLSECWWKAGGWDYPVPVLLSLHDFGTTGRVVLAEGKVRHSIG